MMRIGLLSDTHGYLDDRILVFLNECDEIWRAGDIGNTDIAQRLSSLKPLMAVSGNIDGTRTPAGLSFAIKVRLRGG